MVQTSTADERPQKKEKTIESDRGELAKNPSMVKSNFSLGLKYGEWMNSRHTLVGWGLVPFIVSFEVGLLLMLH